MPNKSLAQRYVLITNLVLYLQGMHSNNMASPTWFMPCSGGVMQYLPYDTEQKNAGFRHSFSPKIDTKGMVFWFTGLSGAGKTTLAYAVKSALLHENKPVVLLDGDMVRRGLCKDLTFSMEDRRENIRRVAEMAKLLAAQGVICLCALITPKEDLRQLARKIIDQNFYEIYVSCPLEVCEKRDVKGNYALARAGQITDYTGIKSLFEIPQNPDFMVQTNTASEEASIGQVSNYVFEKIFQANMRRQETWMLS